MKQIILTCLIFLLIVGLVKNSTADPEIYDKEYEIATRLANFDLSDFSGVYKSENKTIELLDDGSFKDQDYIIDKDLKGINYAHDSFFKYTLIDSKTFESIISYIYPEGVLTDEFDSDTSRIRLVVSDVENNKKDVYQKID